MLLDWRKRFKNFRNFNFVSNVQNTKLTYTINLSNWKMLKLSGKVAVVTASTDGIGYAIAKKLLNEGAQVVISSRKKENVAKAVQSLAHENKERIRGIVCHVANKTDRQNLFNEAVNSFGGIDILVSNAAVNPVFGPLFDCPEDAWEKIFDVNVKSSFLLSKEVLPYFEKRNTSCSIVYVSSIAGLQPFTLLGAYSVSKTALLGLTKAAANELASSNIRVNCVAPGIIKTKFSKAIHESEIAHQEALARIPMNRLGTSEEIADVVSFLCSDESRYITGETIVVAGGMQSRL